MLLSGTYARESGAMYARGHQKWAHVSKATLAETGCCVDLKYLIELIH